LPSVRMEHLWMKTLKYKGEQYQACSPRLAEPGRYTCDAWKVKTGREIRNAETLDALGRKLIKGRRWDPWVKN